MSWLEVAQTLPLGRSTRFMHECGDDKAAIVSHTEAGYSGYCFRCGKLGFEGHGYRTLAQLQKVKDLNEKASNWGTSEEAHRVEIQLEIPTEGLLWLARGGISPSRAKKLGIGWSEEMQRVILPFYDDSGNIIYYQARAVLRGQKPKYLNPSADKSKLLYWGGVNDSYTRVVVTEDILSAIRVGAHIPTCSILGTKISDYQASQLSKYQRISFWLDPDKAGQQGAIDCKRRMSLIHNKIDIITSDRDPKLLSDREIRDKLELPPNHKYEVFGC